MQDAIKTYLFTIVSNEQSWSSLGELHSSFPVRWWSSIMILEIFLKQFTQLPGPRCQGQAVFWVGMPWAPALHVNVDSEPALPNPHCPSQNTSLPHLFPANQARLSANKSPVSKTTHEAVASSKTLIWAVFSVCARLRLRMRKRARAHTHTHTHTHTRLVFSWICIFSIAKEELPSSREDTDHSCRSLCTQGSSEELAVSELWSLHPCCGGITSLLRSYGTKLFFASFCLALY